MAVELAFVVPTKLHVQQVAARLRAADLAELQAVHGDAVDVADVLRRSVRASADSWAAVGQGGAVALLGAAPLSLLSDAACPWMLGADGVMGHRRALVAEGRRRVAGWGARWPLLFNFVDARNLHSIAWLKRLGFVVGEPQPFGVRGLPFRRFERCT